MWRILESRIHGVGVHASCTIPKNTKISKVLLNNKGVFLLTEFGRHVNHQKISNSELKLDKDGNFWLYSIVEINEGEEIVSDYSKAPLPFNSNIRGFKEYE